MEWNEVKRKHEFNDKGTKNQIKRNKPRTQLMIEDFSSRNLLCFVLIKIKGKEMKWMRALILIEQKAQ